MITVKYYSNNSGGSDWLDDDQWKKLSEHGWKTYGFDGDLDRLKYAEKDFDDISDGLKEFEDLTGESISEEGCNCCGPPHEFSWSNNGTYIDSCSGFSCVEYMNRNHRKKTIALEAIASATKTGDKELLKEIMEKFKDDINI